MRLSASRIRSINRAIARVQSSAWSAPVRNPHHTLANPALAVSVNAAEFVKVVVVPRTATV
jgi:predicted ATPase with chaperone activity